MVASSTLSERIMPGFAGRRFSLERICQVIALLIGARCAFAGRRSPVLADGLAYLDLARAYARHDWHTAVNGYWGPLYAWLLAIGMRFFHPGVRTEFPEARAVNFALFAAALYTFSKFWHSVADWSRRTSHDQTTIPAANRSVWIVFGYLLFVTNFVWHVDIVNPDILVAAIVFAIAACLFQLNDRQPHGGGAYAWLGLLLAAGYFAKTIMLYFALFILGAIVVQGFRSGSLRKPLITILVFIMLVSPFVVILSRTLGRFTTGDSGRLNYAWFVNGTETKFWMADSGAGERSFYPGPIVFDSPRVFRLPLIPGVTYAPWYDAARFDKRSHPTFDLRAQLRQLAINLRYPREYILGEGAALTVPLLILAWYTPNTSLRHFASAWFCTLPVAAVFGMYLLVHLVARFVLAFSLVLWGTAWASIFVPSGLQLLARRAMLAGILVSAACATPGLLHYTISERAESTSRDIAIAEAIPHYGITPGDAVASIGNDVAYWAYLARLSVVAEVWPIDSDRFWSQPPEVQQAALRSMGDSGAKAAVWRNDVNRPCPPQWLSLPRGSGCMILLH